MFVVNFARMQPTKFDKCVNLSGDQRHGYVIPRIVLNTSRFHYEFMLLVLTSVVKKTLVIIYYFILRQQIERMNRKIDMIW